MKSDNPSPHKKTPEATMWDPVKNDPMQRLEEARRNADLLSPTSKFRPMMFCPSCGWHEAEDGTIFGEEKCCSMSEPCITASYREIVRARLKGEDNWVSLADYFIAIVISGKSRVVVMHQDPLFQNSPYAASSEERYILIDEIPFRFVECRKFSEAVFTFRVIKDIVEQITPNLPISNTVVSTDKRRPILGYQDFSGSSYESYRMLAVEVLTSHCHIYLQAMQLKMIGLMEVAAERAGELLVRSSNHWLWRLISYRHREEIFNLSDLIYRKTQDGMESQLDLMRGKIALFLAAQLRMGLSGFNYGEDSIYGFLRSQPEIARDVVLFYLERRTMVDVYHLYSNRFPELDGEMD